MDCKVQITIENTIKVDSHVAKTLSKQEFKDAVLLTLKRETGYILDNAVVDVSYTLQENDMENMSFDDDKKYTESMRHQLLDGRDYLMTVASENITVEDALEAFGFGRNGLADWPKND